MYLWSSDCSGGMVTFGQQHVHKCLLSCFKLIRWNSLLGQRNVRSSAFAFAAVVWVDIFTSVIYISWLSQQAEDSPRFQLDGLCQRLRHTTCTAPRQIFDLLVEKVRRQRCSCRVYTIEHLVHEPELTFVWFINVFLSPKYLWVRTKYDRVNHSMSGLVKLHFKLICAILVIVSGACPHQKN